MTEMAERWKRALAEALNKSHLVMQGDARQVAMACFPKEGRVVAINLLLAL